MKLNIKAAALASGIFYGLVAVLCASLVWIWPKEMTQLASWWAHMDFTGLSRMVTLTNFIGGVVLTFLTGFVSGGIFAWLYNKFLGKTAA